MVVLDQFIYFTKFDIKEPKMYARAMQYPNTTQWSKVIEEELD